MKRILLSILIALILIVIYLTITSITFVITNQHPSMIAYIDYPMRLPKLVYFNFFPPSKEDYSMEVSQKKAILSLFFFVANVLLYSIPIYFILWIAEGFKEPKPNEINPPLPPSFTSKD